MELLSFDKLIIVIRNIFRSPFWLCKGRRPGRSSQTKLNKKSQIGHFTAIFYNKGIFVFPRK